MSSNPNRGEALLGQVMGMLTDVEKTAAFGAHLRLMTESLEVAPEIREALRELAETVFPGVSETPPEALAPLKGGIVAFFRQAADLLERPDRAPGWLTDDPVVLQAQGRGSAIVADILHQVAPTLEGLSERFADGGAFCDVGTGVGWLAITAARHWPSARVVGVDVAEAVLELAAQNLASTGLAERIELLHCDVCKLAEEDFDLVWMPGPFLPPTIVPEALRSVHRALRPGGWIAFGTYAGPPNPAAAQVGRLRTIRSGGHPWTAGELNQALGEVGYQQVAEIPKTWHAPLGLVVGRKAG